MNRKTHLLPEQRVYVCVDCGNRLTQSNRPYACPGCGETMRNEGV